MEQDTTPFTPPAMPLPEEVRRFLGRAVLMYGLPFSYLVPDARMLPPESIRFFYVDPGWIATLVQGATSIGRDDAKDSALDTYIRDQALLEALAEAKTVRQSTSDQEPQPTDAHWPLTGFLMRSTVVDGWLGLEMHALDSDGTEIAPLRIDRLAPDIMLCLFNGKVDKLQLKQPPEGMHFGLSPGGTPGEYYRLSLRNLGKTMTVFEANAVLKNESANPGATALVTYNNDAAWSTGAALSADQLFALTSGFAADSKIWTYGVDSGLAAFLRDPGPSSVSLSFDVTVTVPGPGGGSKTERVPLKVSGRATELDIVSDAYPNAHHGKNTVQPGGFLPASFDTRIKAPMRTPIKGRMAPTRTVRVAALASDIQGKLAKYGMKDAVFTSAEYGAEMVESPGFVTFAAEPLS